jgi:hypothetical protein
MTASVFSNPIIPNVVLGGFGIVQTGNIALTQPAPAGGLIVTLESSIPEIILPASITVPAGAKAATYQFTATAPVVNTVAMIVASGGGTSAIGFMWIKSADQAPPTPIPASVSFSNGYVTGGQPATGYVTTTQPAPAGGIALTLTSSNPSLANPPVTVTIPEGTNLVSFSVTTIIVSVDTPVLITATAAGVSQAAFLIVQA